ncbi:oxidoreductase family protein [Nocardia sp. NPDC052566]|uniref:oxidoreductase family protein n=1 Tax=Nocardia sp. NPDC052566 TaxID=3364330 RepID=UPI0037CBF23C
MNSHVPIPQAGDIGHFWLHQRLGWPVGDGDLVEIESLSRTGGVMGTVHRIRCGNRSLIYKTSSHHDSEWGRWAHDAAALEREVRMYRWLQTTPAHTTSIAPHCYWSAIRPDGHGALALQDLGAGIIPNSAMARGLTYPQARAAVRALALLHAHSACTGAPRQPPHPWLLTARSPHLLDAIRMGLEEASVNASLCATTTGPTAAQHFAHADLPTMLVDAHHGARLAAICHGDMWASNLVFAEPGRPQGAPSAFLIDWQFAMWGNPLSDLALLLLSSVHPDARRRWEDQLLAHYHLILTSTTALTYSPADCYSDYQRALPFATLVALAAFDGFVAGMTHTQQLQFAPRVTAALTPPQFCAPGTSGPGFDEGKE